MIRWLLKIHFCHELTSGWIFGSQMNFQQQGNTLIFKHCTNLCKIIHSKDVTFFNGNFVLIYAKFADTIKIIALSFRCDTLLYY